MRIRKQPYGIDFAGNSPEFILRTTPWTQKGRCWCGTFRIDALPAGTLLFSSLRIGGIPGTSELAWEVTDNPGDLLYEMQSASTADAILDSLEARLVYNPTLRQYFDVTAWVDSGSCYLKIKSLNPEPDFVSFYHDDDENAVVWIEGMTGITQKLKPDYRVLAFFTGTACGKRFRTPDMVMEESNGDVRVSCDILRAWFPKPDIPAWGETTGAVPLGANTLAARLWYGEIYTEGSSAYQIGTGDIPVAAGRLDATPRVVDGAASTSLKTLVRSEEITIINGRVAQYAADNNIPDWAACDTDYLYLKSGIDIYGQDNGDNVLTPWNAEQYLYVWNYSTLTVNEDITVSVRYADGSIETWAIEGVHIAPGPNRIAVSLSAIGALDPENVVAWFVQLDNCGVNRQFTVRAHEHGCHQFLMLNTLNLYENLPVEYLAREEQSEGERRLIAGVDGYGTTDLQTVFTARCAPRNAKGLKLLRTAFAKQDNLLLEGKYAWYIDMLPGSLTVSDEESDLTECEFRFRLREKMNREPQVFGLTDELDSAEQIMRTDTVFK